ncbi:MAG TPA: OmpA family protein [Longimicrobiales bacterium]|nr:OmpA family protein [Longimicrobiales bacterium]
MIPSARHRSIVVVLACLFGMPANPAQAQSQSRPDTESSGSGIHALIGGFVGRFDMHAAGETDLFGARAGVGFRELVQLTGFYWRGFDTSGDSITADHAWGGELQLNLNTGFGITPFVTGGLARVDQDGTAAQTAAIAGAGLTFPLGPVLLHAAARDYMFGVSGLEGDASPDDVTHNWLYSAGVKFALGSRRPSRTIAVAAPAVDQRALREATAELAELRDSLRMTGPGRSDAADTLTAARSFQSERQIVVPIPTEGSITLRYGPEPAAVPPPVVVTVPGASPAAGIAADRPRSAPPLTEGASLQDPETRAWLQQIVAAEVADQLMRRPATTPALTPSQVDALAERVLAGVIAGVLPRLDAAQALRMNELRNDLRAALLEPRETPPGELARAPVERTPPVAPDVVTPPPAAAPQVATPAPAPAERQAGDESAAEAAAAIRLEAAQRTALTAAASMHSRFLSASETDRGPAAVLEDAAFEAGAALVSPGARAAVAAVAEVLRAHPDRRVYIQGHTDDVGTELQNQRLSELRAEAVRSLLVQDGVAADRLFAIGYGQGRPVADNATGQGRALNRRVEIVLGESRTMAAK